MRILFYTDPHVCTYSSIVRSNGKVYSTRLENCINSINWVESIATQRGCDLVLCGGDFWDKSEINAQEATVVREIHWANCAHGFIIGNHEIGRGNRQFSSAHLFALVPGLKIFDQPEYFDVGNNTTLCLLPYILEQDRLSISDYFPDDGSNKVIFSHNDIKGIQMGKFLSQTGFDIADIENNCMLFLNGHLHNGCELAPGVINLGNLTGQNFSEDATKYNHSICIVDTDTFNIEYIENPYAFNFYKLDLTTGSFDFSKLKNNSVVSVKVFENRVSDISEMLKSDSRVVESRVLLAREDSSAVIDTTDIPTINASDHLKMFEEFVLQYIGNDEIVLSELENLMR